jgi:hypothetical protein
MNRAPWKFAPLLALAIFSLPALAADDIAKYVHRIPLQTEGTAAWYRLDLPMSVRWAAAHADLRDLRVFNAEGEALPHTLASDGERRVETRREAAARLFPLEAPQFERGTPEMRIRRDRNGVLVEILPPTERTQSHIRRGWILDVSALDAPLESLILDYDESTIFDGVQRFSIEASDDLEHWRNWGEGQFVRLSFEGERIEQREVRLPGRKARYLRLLWLPDEGFYGLGGSYGLKGARITGTEAGVKPAPLVWSPALPGQAVEGREGEFIWQLPLALPLKRARIAVPQPNTLAPVIVFGRRLEKEVPTTGRPSGERLTRRILHGKIPRHPIRPARPAGEAAWQTLARGVLYRLPAADQEVVQEELELSGLAVNQLRLQLDPRGGGLGNANAAPQLSVALQDQQVIFLARGSAPYHLAFGRAEAKSAALPLATLMPGYTQRSAFGLARLASETALPAQEAVLPAPPPASSFDQKKFILWAILLAGVALLTGMAWSLLRSNKKPEAGQSEK